MDQVPYVFESPDPLGARIVTEIWPHDEVLTHYAELLKSDPPTES